MDKSDLKEKLLLLSEEHRDLDDAIHALIHTDSMTDQLKVQRLKKRKLNLKDEITRIKALILPDIIA